MNLEAESELSVFVANTIADFLAEAEGGKDEAPIEAGPALIELAAVALSEVVLIYEQRPEDAIELAVGRVASILSAHFEHSKRPNLRLVWTKD